MRRPVSTLGLGQRAGRAAAVNVTLNGARQVLQLGVMLVMVRLLSPENYGELALVLAIMGFIAVFDHKPFLAYVLQTRDDEPPDYHLYFSMGGLIQGAAFAVSQVVGLALAWSGGRFAPVAPYVHLMGLSFLLDWPGDLRRRMLERNLDWVRLAVLQAVGLVVSAVGTIGLALAGAGTYALVVPGLVLALPLIVDLLALERWRPRWRFDPQAFVPAVRFGLARLGSTLLSRGRRLVQGAAIVYLLGYEEAGLFERAIGIATIVRHGLAEHAVHALYPFLTRLEPGGAAWHRAARLVLAAVGWAALPAALSLALLAGPVVALVYGSGWSAVVALLPAAMALGAVRALVLAVFHLVLGCRGERVCFALDALTFAGNLALLAVLWRGDLAGYVAGLAVLEAVAMALALRWLGMNGGLEPGAWIAALGPAAAACGLATAGAFALTLALGLDRAAPAGALTFLAAFGGGYVLALRWLFAAPLADLLARAPGGAWMTRALRLP